MATISGIRGMLLEEAILFLLRNSGYKTITDDRQEPELLHLGSAGMEIFGRGGVHQIDAIADFMISPPFSYPQRLLVEAKCYSSAYKVDIETARNAIGVLKDVNEFWVTRNSRINKKRYHYLYAIFSATGFTEPTEKYAYAHDIYLMNLHRSEYILPIISSIRAISDSTFNSISVVQKDLREYVRQRLLSESTSYIQDSTYSGINSVENFINECRRLNHSYLATLGGHIPVFLTPSPNFTIESLNNIDSIKVMRDDKKWYIETLGEQRLFSFDLPLELFKQYQRNGELTRKDALNLKREYMSSIQLFMTGNTNVSRMPQMRVIELKLDIGWLDNILQREQEGERERGNRNEQ